MEAMMKVQIMKKYNFCAAQHIETPTVTTIVTTCNSGASYLNGRIS